jgi:hypothetical protein
MGRNKNRNSKGQFTKKLTVKKGASQRQYRFNVFAEGNPQIDTINIGCGPDDSKKIKAANHSSEDANEIPTQDLLRRIANEVRAQEKVAFEEANVNALKQSNQHEIVEKKCSELRAILSDNSLRKVEHTKEYDFIKSQFYYDTIYQIMELRNKIMSEVRNSVSDKKEGEIYADAFIIDIKRELGDIWFNDKKDLKGIADKEQEIKIEEEKEKEIIVAKKIALDSIPKRSAIDIDGGINDDEIIDDDSESIASHSYILTGASPFGESAEDVKEKLEKAFIEEHQKRNEE